MTSLRQNLTELTPELPQGYVLRPAIESDQWLLQKLVWEFQIAEALDFDLRVFSYRVLVLGLLAASLVFQIYVFRSVNSELLRLIVSFGMTYVCVQMATSLYSLLLLLKYSLFGVSSTWERYWVIERDRQIVACVSLVTFKTEASLGYLYVKPEVRSQGLATHLLKHLITKSSIPISLVCKPKMIKFYADLGFVEVPWLNLSPTVKAIYHIFRPHPKLIGFPLVVMQWQTQA
jgi:N-acetylglutamate synthase-like GNAT family acetyltransferase